MRRLQFAAETLESTAGTIPASKGLFGSGVTRVVRAPFAQGLAAGGILE
jgi:hypothetical protein